jgi:hypothetical protein
MLNIISENDFPYSTAVFIKLWSAETCGSAKHKGCEVPGSIPGHSLGFF